MRALVLALAAAWAGVVAGGVGAAGGCERRATYSQETPDDVVESLVAMVKAGEASRIDDLIYAESDRMRAVLHRLGELMGSLQLLAAAVQERFPEEVAKLRAEAVAAAKAGEARGITLNLGGRGGGDGRDRFREMAGTIFADPYGWIDRNAERLSTMRLADDMATVTLDDRPVLPPLGIPLRLASDGKWYISLPTNMPGVSRLMPRTETEWSIIGSMLKVFENTTAELTADVRAGRVTGIDQLAEKAGEKVIWPALLTWGAYNRELDVRRRHERLTRQFDTRRREWAKAAEASGKQTPRQLAGAIDALVPRELERLARKDERPNIERMSDREFAEFLESALAAGGLSVAIAQAPDVAEIEEAVRRWEAGRAKADALKTGG